MLCVKKKKKKIVDNKKKKKSEIAINHPFKGSDTNSVVVAQLSPHLQQDQENLSIKSCSFCTYRGVWSMGSIDGVLSELICGLMRCWG